MTPANVGDTDMFDALVQGDLDVMYADAAYESRKRTRRLEEMGIGNAVMHRVNQSASCRFSPMTRARV